MGEVRIKKVGNGFTVFMDINPSYVTSDDNTFVFNTFASMSRFLKERLTAPDGNQG